MLPHSRVELKKICAHCLGASGCSPVAELGGGGGRREGAFYGIISRTLAVSSTNFGSILIFASCIYWYL